MGKRFIPLFEGLTKGEIPFDGKGYIVNAVFDHASAYSKFEIIAFKNVKNIMHGGDSVTFHSDGYKIFMVFEPSTYQYRFQEPYLRSGKAHIPMRWNELDTLDLSTKDRIHISHQPYMSYGAFTVEQPEQGDFVYYFYETPQVQVNIGEFLTTILQKELRVPKSSLPEIAGHIQRNLDYFNKEADAV